MLQMIDPPPESEKSVSDSHEANAVQRIAAVLEIFGDLEHEPEDIQATMLACLLANFAGYKDLPNESSHIKQHFAQWGLTAVRGSAFSFRHIPVAIHAAAQAAADLCASKEQYPAVDLLSPVHHKERAWWTEITTRGIETYKNVLGGKTTDVADRLYRERLTLVKQ